MSLIAMAAYCTESNGRAKYLKQALQSIKDTVNLDKHDFYVVDNNCCKEAIAILQDFYEVMRFKWIHNTTNEGTAKAINAAWKERKQGQHCIKIDDDMVVHCNDWVEQLEEVVERDNTIGQVGLKRVDVWESVNQEREFFRTTLYQLPHELGQRWVVVEIANHIIGSCVLHSSLLLDKIGYMIQPTTYGLDDTLTSIRSKLAGFKNVFLPHIVVEHLEGTPVADWQKEKEKAASEGWNEYVRLGTGYTNGSIPVYYNPYG